MQFDLKNATVTIKDGFSGSSSVVPKINNGAGYPEGTNTVTIDNVTGIIANGTIFTVPTDDTLYAVSDHTETSSNTTSITFNPALNVSVADNDVLTIQPHQLEIKIGQGTLTYNETRKVEYTLDRGRLDTVRLGDEEPLDVRFDFTWEFLKGVGSSGVPTIEDALKQRGEAADWVSTSSDDCEPYAVDIIINYTPPCIGEDTETITLPDFRWESLNHDAKAGTVAVTGKCNVVEAEVTRSGGS